MPVRFPDVTVTLVGTDGNVFSVINLVWRAIRNSGRYTEAQEFKRECFASKNYDAVLQLAMSTVNVE